MNDRLRQRIPFEFTYSVFFVERLFVPENRLFEELLEGDGDSGPRDVVFALDNEVARLHPHLIPELLRRAGANGGVWRLAGDPILIPGGETAKNSDDVVDEIHARVHGEGVCRHSYVVAIGGGGVLDAVGYAAATAHRGLRLIRVPTTVLSQNDSGVGIKNGINAFGKKNFLGTFAPPFAVLNDFSFLPTLEDRDWRSGIAEAVKVALIKDPAFFDFLESNAAGLVSRDLAPMRTLVRRCAELHLGHISESGDPFELGSSRPLDFGHWAAHKLEQITGYALRHGETVAIGIALDCTYAHLAGLLPRRPWDRILRLFEAVGLEIHLPFDVEAAEEASGFENLFAGLEEFREHLGGELTLLLVTDIGSSIEVHQVDRRRYVQAIRTLGARARQEIDV